MDKIDIQVAVAWATALAILLALIVVGLAREALMYFVGLCMGIVLSLIGDASLRLEA